MQWNDKNLVKVLKNGGVVVMPTDTIYGIVGRAENKATVERIYKIRKRTHSKPCIILISDLNEVKKFGIILSEGQQEKIKELNEPTSFVVDCDKKEFEYLHRDKKSLAFRIPALAELRTLLLQTGPLVAPSANVEGGVPVQTSQEAITCFGDLVDLYIDGNPSSNKASRVIKLESDGSMVTIRE